MVGCKVMGAESSALDTLVDNCHVADSGSHGLHLEAHGSVAKHCIVSNSGYYGIYVGDYGQVLGSTVTGATYGVYLNDFAELSDSYISKATSAGVSATYFSAIRDSQIVRNAGRGIWATGANVEIKGNTIAGTTAEGGTQIGVQTADASCVLTGNRLSANGINLQGLYTNGGGNILQ
jgi:hypothetical protein